MALRKSKQAAARSPAFSALGAAIAVALVFEHVTKAGEFALNDVVEMGALPAGMVLAGPVVVACDDLDSGGAPAVTLDVGLMSGEYLAAKNSDGSERTCGNEFVAASTVGQAGGVFVQTKSAGLLLTPSQSDRSIGVKVAAAPQTLVAGAKIRLHVPVVPALTGI